MSARKWLLVPLALVTLALVSCNPEAGQSGQTESETCPYLLPFDGTRRIQVSQGNSGSKSHYGIEKYAFDFDLDIDRTTGIGEPVLASRAGVIANVKDGQTACGGQDQIGHTNYVVIDHRDGTYAEYLHLQTGIPVTKGQEVQQGQVIGYTGNTGYTECGTSAGGGYHLHFQVQRSKEIGSQSIPICFADVEGDGIPNTEDWVRSQNLQQGTVLVPGPEIGEIGGYVSGIGGTQTDPMEEMVQDCRMAPTPAGYPNPDPLKDFEMFRSLWRDAGVIPDPEPQSMWDISERISYTPAVETFWGPPCTYVKFKNPDGDGFYLIYRTRAGEIRKVLIGGTADSQPLTSMPESLIGIWEGDGTGALTFHQMPDVKVHFRVEISRDASGKFIIVVEEDGNSRTYYQRETSYGFSQWPDDEGWYNFDDAGDPTTTVVYVQPIDNDTLEIEVSYLSGSSWGTLQRIR